MDANDEQELLGLIKYLDTTAQTWLAQGNVGKAVLLSSKAQEHFGQMERKWSRPSAKVKETRQWLQVLLNSSWAQCLARQAAPDAQAILRLMEEAVVSMSQVGREHLNAAIESVYTGCYNAALSFFKLHCYDVARYVSISSSICFPNPIKKKERRTDRMREKKQPILSNGNRSGHFQQQTRWS